jgi:hypothetical protein
MFSDIFDFFCGLPTGDGFSGEHMGKLNRKDYKKELRK